MILAVNQLLSRKINGSFTSPVSARHPQHIIQRGTNRQACFASEEDFAAYANWLDECARKNGVAIHVWVFMTNHVHLLATSEKTQGISRMKQTLGRHYVRYFNHTYRRTGTLWEGRFKSCVVDAEEYLLVCQRYIELNPVGAGMVESPGDYVWSSYKANGLGASIKMWTPHKIYQELGIRLRSVHKLIRSFLPGILMVIFLRRYGIHPTKGWPWGMTALRKK